MTLKSFIAIITIFDIFIFLMTLFGSIIIYDGISYDIFLGPDAYIFNYFDKDTYKMNGVKNY